GASAGTGGSGVGGASGSAGAGAAAGAAGTAGSGGQPGDPCAEILSEYAAAGVNCEDLGSQSVAANAIWGGGCSRYSSLVVQPVTVVADSDPAGKPTALIADTIEIQAGATLSLDGKGFAQGLGPGHGATFENTYGSGAGHGGKGLDRGTAPGGGTYGVAAWPVSAGSGGGIGVGDGGSGGGALLLCARQSITVDGLISVDGAGSGQGGGGAGGSLLLVSPRIQGAGSLSARGGLATWSVCGGAGASGGGGRIALRALDNLFTGTIDVSGPTLCYGTAGTGTSYSGPLP
ncbi:MAG: hypothetical protein KC492_16875, partial [Myxococcales bacterium]|nr:hypothetical protein [Myxococcales bacterium]